VKGISVLGKTRLHTEENRIAAAIILRDVDKFGGEGALPVMWARMVVERSVQDADAGPVFRASAA
jgi:hypothetical protein